MSRETSTEAWHDMRDSELLGKRQREALDIIRSSTQYHKGPRTAGELFWDSPGSLWKRLSELRTKGFIVECEPRECTVTGKRAITWELADALVQRAQPEGTCRECGRMFFHADDCERRGQR